MITEGERVRAKAVQVFGSQEKADAWLHRPLAALNEMTPVKATYEKDGFKTVMNLLGMIEHGVYS